MSEPTRIRSVARAARILLLVAEHPDGLTAKETALALRLPVATTHHLLGTLVAESLLAKDSRRKYRLGPAVGTLAHTFLHRLGPPEHQLVGLRRLADETGETAYLSGWRGGEIVVLASVEGNHAVRVSGLHVGFSGHAHARAGGKVMLAFAREAVLDAYLAAHPLERLTARTITDEAAFGRELDRIRRRGHAFDYGEFQEGVACVAAPVVELGVATAAFGISAPATRFRQSRRDLVEATLATAASIEMPRARTASVP
jgi:DNA-binding IclR family transcriptional regulator